MPVIDAAAARRLRDEFFRLRGVAGNGFHSDLVVEDPAYREAADRVLAEALDASAAALFEDHEPFLRSFLCKYPGEESSLYLHQDWMYVDERTGERTHAVWIALDDITGHNGQLRVLRGSHRLDDRPRGSDLIAPWIHAEGLVEPRLLSVPVPAGHGVVFDNALVHSSYPNNTSEPRLAVAIGLRRRGTPLVHFRRSPNGHADRYDCRARLLPSVLASIVACSTTGAADRRIGHGAGSSLCRGHRPAARRRSSGEGRSAVPRRRQWS